MLSRAAEFFDLGPARIPSPDELALRRAAQRRGKVMVDANRCLRRIISQARWAFPDVWNACAGSRSTALAVLRRWPHLEHLAKARTSSIIEVVAKHTRGVAGVEKRATEIRDAARSWSHFWDGHLDLDALAWETAELLDDFEAAEARVDRSSGRAREFWEGLYGDDPLLLSVSGPAVGGDDTFRREQLSTAGTGRALQPARGLAATPVTYTCRVSSSMKSNT